MSEKEGLLERRIFKVLTRVNENYTMAYRKPASLDAQTTAFKGVTKDIIGEMKQEFMELLGVPYFSPDGWRQQTLPHTQKVIEWATKWMGELDDKV